METLTDEQTEKIKELYFLHRDSMSLKDIFKNFLGEYFGEFETEGKGHTKEFMAFVTMTTGWRREEEQKELESLTKNLTEEDADALLSKNRRDAIVLFSNIITKWKVNPRKISAASLKELISLYRVIRSSEEAQKRTKLAELKEKREVVKMLLPYMRLTLPQLEVLKVKVNESFARIIQLKSSASDSGKPGGGIATRATE